MIFTKSKSLVGSHSRKFWATTEVESIYVPCLTNQMTFFNLFYLPVSIFSPYRFISPSCPMALIIIIQVPAGLSLSFLAASSKSILPSTSTQPITDDAHLYL